FNKTTHSVLLLFQWLPGVFFPIICAQGYGMKDRIDFSTFSWMLQRRLRLERGVYAGSLPCDAKTNRFPDAGRAVKRPEGRAPARPGRSARCVWFGICLFAASSCK